jgi:bacterioferritin
MIIGQLGGEPDFTPAPYPFDPTNRATILKSYVVYEEKLIPHYNGEADQVDDPHIKRVLQREAWESALHARKFQRRLDKLSPEEAAGLAEQESELPQDFMDRLQSEVTSKYTEMLQHVRTSWVFQKEGMKGWQIMDQAIEKMRHLAHFAEEIAENGVPPQFNPGKIDINQAIGQALKKALEDVQTAHSRHVAFQEDAEVKKHSGLVINMDRTAQQEAFQAEELKDWMKD